ncbi:hypothetical protein [Streptomyces sp. 11-1-2]|nr:hypothetical protein [Streptomyces sp. 11-1-2]
MHYTLQRRHRRGAGPRLAAALHAALYGDLEPLARAVPAVPS